MTGTLIILVICVFFSTFVQRVTGFGSGIVFMSVACYIIPVHGEATALSGMLSVVCAGVTGLQLIKHLKWKKLAVILPVFLIVSYFAVGLVAHIDSMLLKRIMGAVLIVLSLYFMFVNGKIQLKATVPVQLAAGGLSGLMGGLFGMQGPPAVVYFISCTDEKEEYMALTQWYFIIGNLFMTAYRAENGFITAEVAEWFALCVPAALLGLFVGEKVYSKLPVRTLRKLVYGFIGVAGLSAIIF